MKNCPSCGSPIENENAKLCVSCGAVIETSSNSTAQYYQAAQNAEAEQAAAAQYPMKWYKFLIYVSLFIGVALNAYTAFNYLAGKAYVTSDNTNLTDLIYEILGGSLKTIDIIYGVALLAVAAFGIYTRFTLAQFRADGPKYLYILLALSSIIPFLKNIATYMIIKGSEFSSVISTESIFTSIASLCFTFVYIKLNHIYFTKRKSLFTK